MIEDAFIIEDMSTLIRNIILGMGERNLFKIYFYHLDACDNLSILSIN